MSPSPDHAAPTIVVVEDDEHVLASLKFSLEIDGFAVTLFRSAEELLEGQLGLPQSKAAACLVVDLLLPGMDGLDLVSRLRAEGVDTPAFLITSSPPAHVRQRAAAAGVAIVGKPLLGNALADLIRSTIETP